MIETQKENEGKKNRMTKKNDKKNDEQKNDGKKGEDKKRWKKDGQIREIIWRKKDKRKIHPVLLICYN